MATFPPHFGINFVPTTYHTIPDSSIPSLQSLPSPLVVCITGASRGIGAATAKAFAQAGATGLLLIGSTESAGLQTTKSECEALAKSPDLQIATLGLDITLPEAGQRIIDTIKSHFGRLDILINNAAIVSSDVSAFDRFQDINVSQIRDPLETNYIARFAVLKATLPLLLASESVKIVLNISSAKQHAAADGALGYNISSLANARMTEALAETYGERGLFTCAVHPGVVATTLPLGMPPVPAEFKAWMDPPGLCGAFLVRLVGERPMWLNGRYVSANWDMDELLGMEEDVVREDKLKMRMVV